MALIAGGGSPKNFVFFDKNFGETGYQRNARVQARALITGPKRAKPKNTTPRLRGVVIYAMKFLSHHRVQR